MKTDSYTLSLYSVVLVKYYLGNILIRMLLISHLIVLWGIHEQSINHISLKKGLSYVKLPRTRFGQYNACGLADWCCVSGRQVDNAEVATMLMLLARTGRGTPRDPTSHLSVVYYLGAAGVNHSNSKCYSHLLHP